jgi:hypothetical protein
MRCDAGMSIRILIVLASALTACGGHRSIGAGIPGDRSPYVWRGDGQDAAVDVVNGVTEAAWTAATQNDDPATPLCTPESESGNPPNTCPAKTEQPAVERPR